MAGARQMPLNGVDPKRTQMGQALCRSLMSWKPTGATDSTQIGCRGVKQTQFQAGGGRPEAGAGLPTAHSLQSSAWNTPNKANFWRGPGRRRTESHLRQTKPILLLAEWRPELSRQTKPMCRSEISPLRPIRLALRAGSSAAGRDDKRRWAGSIKAVAPNEANFSVSGQKTRGGPESKANLRWRDRSAPAEATRAPDGSQGRGRAKQSQSWPRRPRD